ncbi:hypothetical protein EJB05_31576, partial [Eragrostis curvula]
MGTVLDALAMKILSNLGDLIQDEVVMTLRVKKDIKMLKNNLEHFCAVREDAEALAMGNTVTESWWKEMRDVMFDVDDVIDLFMVHSKNPSQLPRLVCFNQSLFSCFAKITFDHRIAKRIKNINEKLLGIKERKEMFSLERTNCQQFQVTAVDRSQTSPISVEIVGIDMKKASDDMVKLIISNCNSNSSTLFGIHGMGGIGKTTLAQKIYQEQRIREKFQIHIWLCISQSYTEIDLLKQAIRMAGGSCDQLEAKSELLPRLMDTVNGKTVFLVLDDVWKSDVWNELLQTPFETGLNALILVTTRNRNILEQMHARYTHKVNKMNSTDGLELLMKRSFRPDEQTNDGFWDVGRQIVQNCDGLPLAIKVIAGVLSAKRTIVEWESIRDSEWFTHGLPEDVTGPLYLSYRHLPPQLKQCFIWCALLPPNFEIKRDSVAYWWVAEGFVRKEHNYAVYQIAEDYYHELIRRNLLQPKPEYVDKGISTMHDLLRSLGQHLTRDHSLFMDAESKEILPKLRRLGISGAVQNIPAIEKQKFMRSLLIYNNKNFKSLNEYTFRNIEHIRVLFLSGMGILSIPQSIGNLVLLRLLDLSFTDISILPESIGNLISLEYLSLLGCHKLNSLPSTLMRLSNISFLQLDQTAIDHVPKGIEKFQKLYNLRGVFESGTGLPNIQRLWVEKLEQATLDGELVLMKCRNLRELGLRCTIGMSRTRCQTNDVGRIQQVYEMLVPSPSLVYIFLIGFPGVMFPEWLRSEPEQKLPNLAHMHLDECISCSQLPPAGQMPELQVLQIRAADAIVTIGAEILGKGVISASAFFPKLELLHIIDMRNLEYWSLNMGNLFENMEAMSQQLVLMPSLKRLLLLDCPKLNALPEDLQRINSLKRIHIEGAHMLQEIVSIPSVVWLKIKNNRSLRKISNLSGLQDLFAQDCPELDQADSLIALKRLYMVDCLKAQPFWKCLPKDQGVLIHIATPGADGRDIFPDESLYN